MRGLPPLGLGGSSGSSGYFYEDPHIGHKGRIGSLKKQFIEVAQMELEPSRDAVVPPVT